MVSVIIPTYNRAHIIEETLTSITKQSHVDWECIIVDDHSSDQIEELIQTYIEKDSRFRYYKRPDAKKKGPSACRNYGYEQSKGDFIQFFDSDDIMHQDHLKMKMEAFLDERIDLTFCKIQRFYGNFGTSKLEPTTIARFSDNLLEDLVLGKFTLVMNAPMWRKRFLLNHKMLDEDIVLNEDLEFHSRLIATKPSYKFVDEDLIYMRSGDASITNTYFKNPGLYIDDYLEVKKRTLRLDPDNQKINSGLMKMVLAQFRACLDVKDYASCSKILRFVKQHIADRSVSTKFKLFRIEVAYYIFKRLGRGDTRFKKMLKI